jgi:hypothetical protein
MIKPLFITGDLRSFGQERARILQMNPDNCLMYKLFTEGDVENRTKMLIQRRESISEKRKGTSKNAKLTECILFKKSILVDNVGFTTGGLCHFILYQEAQKKKGKRKNFMLSRNLSSFVLDASAS